MNAVRNLFTLNFQAILMVSIDIFIKRLIKLKDRLVKDSISRYWVEKGLQGTTRFPRACAELPQASPSGISPIMFIPQGVFAVPFRSFAIMESSKSFT
ncbi:MAG: hypothetical protein WAM07_06345 [Halobacillus sp.]|uniref:hypothetical protein n=1 Tax=Halobacillus sp. TaxID=56800 RepID=UPI003BAF77E7